VCLSIAGSDSGGGAGIQADLKAFAAAGVHGTTAITALTAQNTVAVTLVEAVSPAMIAAQIEAVASDFQIGGIKIGMLGALATIEAVGRALARLDPEIPVVQDPVMVSESGARLLDGDALDALRELIVPRATVITPNLPEARVLTGSGDAEGDGERLLRGLLALGPRWAMVTGGHRDEAIDLLARVDPAGDGALEIFEFRGPRHPDGAAHGSGPRLRGYCNAS